MIGLKRGTVKLAPHDQKWDKIFKKEKKKLLNAIGFIIIKIEHVGSTAISTIPAKPIIDIAISVKSLKKTKKYIGKIKMLGYEEKRENKLGGLFFAKGPEKNRVVYLHIGDESTDYIEDMILFRDYLIQNSSQAKKYAKLKRELSKKFSDNREKYTAAKDKFIQRALRRAKNGRNYS